MKPNNSAAKILETVIENGRIDDDGNGDFDRDSLITEVEFEATERGLSPDETAKVVEWALAHARTN